MQACNHLSTLIGLNSYGPLVTQNSFYLYLQSAVPGLDYPQYKKKKVQPYKGHEKPCKCKTSPVYLYCRLFPAWLTRTRRSNVLWLHLPAEMTASHANRQEAAVLSSWREPNTALAVWQINSAKPPERATASAEAGRADSTLCSKDGSLFTTGCDTFTKCSEIHFSHFAVSCTRSI